MTSPASDPSYTYKFKVLSHHGARVSQNEPHITVTFLAGPGNHLVYCGTFTMAEAEWTV